MNPEEIGQHLEQYDYEYFLNSALERVPEGIDTREGSIIYDAIAPASYQMAFLAMEMRKVVMESFSQTASGRYLDLKAQEHGVSRLTATQAVVKLRLEKEDGHGYLIAESGTRFSSVGDNPVYYKVINHLGEGYYTAQSETPGIIGNHYIGTLLPIDNFNGLGDAKLIEVVIPARDEEDDESLRTRILRDLQILNYGGNIEDYIQFTMRIDGVGAVQVYPIWRGGGTVKVVILDTEYNLANQSLLSKAQEIIDPGSGDKGYGVAPIGHKVTVDTPVKKVVSVSLHIDTIVGKTLEEIKPSIEDKLKEFFLSLRKSWSNHDDAYKYNQVIYQSQLMAQLLNVDGVANVSKVTFNGIDGDLLLSMHNDLQECAFLGEVSYT